MSDLQSRFEAFIASKDFPCVGAKAARARKTITVIEGQDITASESDVRVHEGLHAFGQQLDHEAAFVQSCVVVYRGPCDLDEVGFENALWRRLQRLHELDRTAGHAWAKGVSDDPASPHFSMSLGGNAFFVVGLHPGASRPARRFDHPALVFNSHEQFERLRADGRFAKMQKVIRERDRALSGTINPMLAEFGRASEARQYSGRRLGPEWRCPFQPREQAR